MHDFFLNKIRTILNGIFRKKPLINNADQLFEFVFKDLYYRYCLS